MPAAAVAMAKNGTGVVERRGGARRPSPHARQRCTTRDEPSAGCGQARELWTAQEAAADLVLAGPESGADLEETAPALGRADSDRSDPDRFDRDRSDRDRSEPARSDPTFGDADFSDPACCDPDFDAEPSEPLRSDAEPSESLRSADSPESFFAVESLRAADSKLCCLLASRLSLR